MALTAAGNKTLARERNNYLKKTNLRFVFKCAKISHITSLTNRKLYGLTSVIYDTLVLITDSLLVREMSLMSMPRNFFSVTSFMVSIRIKKRKYLNLLTFSGNRKQVSHTGWRGIRG